MKVDRDGREVYCKVTDVYGNSVKSNTAKMNLKSTGTPDEPDEPVTPLAITSQPSSVTVAEGETATFTVKATGDGLTYTWYYRNAGTTTWKEGSSTTSSYSLVMKAERDGREIYCKITDANGNTVKTNKVKMTMED